MKNDNRQDQSDDRLYARPVKKIADFAFDENVARVFPDMIERSVPGYAALIPLIGMLAEHYIRPGARCYDLGCSLGAVSFSIAHFLRASDKDIQGCRIVAIDNSPAMIERCRQHLQSVEAPIDLVCADIRSVAMEDACVVVLNFTLQFIEPAERAAVVRKIYDGMRPGGVLIVSEKIRIDPLLDDLHHAFKKANGYSELEIAQKRNALEKVLIPESVDAHMQRLRACGFKQAFVWFQCLNFVSLLALKE